jgi:DNA polymerase III alpha subunit
LNALTVIDDTIRMIKERYGRDLDEEFDGLRTLPLDDPIIYKRLSEGYTRGCFQVEQSSYTNLLIRSGGVKNFAELAASNALVRPGAINSSAGEDYIERKEGRKIVEYHHPDMKWFTEETYGALIYQEQVMLTMTELAGMSMVKADKVRKIIGKKRDVSEFEQYKAEFVAGASEKVGVARAEALWHDFEAHADYSFNKSHAVAYSMLTYWTAWLKEYYPMEFMCATLRNENDKDKMVDYLMETKRLGIKVVLPHINKSAARFEIQTDERGDFVRFGLSNIKNISTKGAASLMAYGPYKNYKHLYDTIAAKGNGLNVRMLQGLNAVGGAVFPDHPLTGNERDNFYEYLGIPAFKSAEIPPRIRAQFRDLDEYSDHETFVAMGMCREVKVGDGWARVKFMDETGSASAFTDQNTQIETGQLYVIMFANNRIVKYVTVDDLVAGEGGTFRSFLGAESFPDVPPGMLKVVSFRMRLTKNGDRMADVVFSDEYKNLTSAMVWPGQFMQAHTHMREGQVVDVVLSKTKDGTAQFVSRIL